MVGRGDTVLLEEAWEDASGNYRDEYVTVAKVLPDGTFTVRIGDWRTRTANEQHVQAWLNKMEWYAKDYEPFGLARPQVGKQ